MSKKAEITIEEFDNGEWEATIKTFNDGDESISSVAGSRGGQVVNETFNRLKNKLFGWA